jgi:hypothetical protein
VTGEHRSSGRRRDVHARRQRQDERRLERQARRHGRRAFASPSAKAARPIGSGVVVEILQ